LSPSQGFPKSSRLLCSADYSRVFDSVDYRVSTKHFLVLAKTNQDLGLRLGIIVAKKHVKLSVQRNRIKRLMRESFRAVSQPIENLDMVILAKQGTGSTDNPSCLSEINDLWKKLSRKQNANS
jgi:ribonuclease P protein component